MEKISVIVPVYNVAAYVARTIDSLLSQTYPSVEIIIIDDGSTDGSSAIVDSYATREGVHILHQTNQGVSAARNAGLAIASGEFIAFVDADDTVSPDYLAALHTELDATNADLAVELYANVFPDGHHEPSTRENIDKLMSTKEFIEYQIYGGRDTSCYVKLFKSTIIRANNLRFDTAITNLEDMLFLLTYCLHSHAVVCSPQARYYRTVRTDGVVFSAFSPRKLTAITAYEKAESVLLAHDGFQYLVERNAYQKLRNIIYFLIQTYLAKEMDTFHRLKALAQKTIADYSLTLAPKERIKLFCLWHFPKIFTTMWNHKNS